MNEINSHGKKHWAKTTTWLLASNIIRNLASIAIVVLLARLTSSRTLGDYALALALTTPIFAFLQFGLKGVYLTLKGTTAFSSFLKVQLFSVILAVIISVAISAITSPAILLTVFLVSLIKTNDAFSELLSGPLQKYGKPNLIFWAYGSTAVVGTISIAVLLYFGCSLNMSLAILAIVSFSITAAILLQKSIGIEKNQARNTSLQKESLRREYSQILKAGLPTGVAASILSLVITIPQYQVAASAGTADVGYLATLLYGLAVVDIFLGTLTQAWIPRAQELLHISETEANAFGKGLLKSVLLWSALMVPAAIVGVYLMALIFPPLLGSDFKLTLSVAVPLCGAIILSPAQHFAGVGLVVKNHYFRSVIPSAFAAGTAAVAGYVFIEMLSLSSQGALWAVATALGVRGTVTLLMVLNKAQGINKDYVDG